MQINHAAFNHLLNVTGLYAEGVTRLSKLTPAQMLRIITYIEEKKPFHDENTRKQVLSWFRLRYNYLLEVKFKKFIS